MKIVKKNKICVVGWHYFSNVYKQLSQSDFDVYVVAHRYHEILDDLKLNYTITKNIGLEYHAYDWYIKNVWDGESGVLFMHDDIGTNDSFFDVIFKKADSCDELSIFGSNESHKFYKYSGRCFYYSGRLIGHLLKEYDGIFYDINDKGYSIGKGYQQLLYDANYTKDFCVSLLSKNKLWLKYVKKLIKKYKLKSKYIKFDDCVFNWRGLVKNGVPLGEEDKDIYYLNDNSIFGIEQDHVLEDMADKIETKKKRDYHYYTKWYNFYFNSFRFNNMNILEIGENSSLWKLYFKNSDIYNIDVKGNFSHNEKNIFSSKDINNDFFKRILSEVPLGFDIIIDSGDISTLNRKETFEFLFDKLNPGGIYVIEDSNLRYKDKNNIVNFLKEKIDDINYNGKFNINNYEKIYNKEMERNERIISGAAFHAGICFVFKKFYK